MRKIRILSALICALSVFVMLPAITTMAAGSKPYWKATEPRSGQKPDYDVMLPTSITPVDCSLSSFINGVCWLDSEGNILGADSVFEAKKEYTIMIFYNDDSDISPKINNEEVVRHLAKDWKGEGIAQMIGAQYYCEKTFTVPTSVNKVTVSRIDKPAAGHTPVYSLTQIQYNWDSGIRLTDVLWKEGTSAGTDISDPGSYKFISGKKYFLMLTFEAKDGHYFTKDNITCVLNDETLSSDQIGISNNGKTLYMYYQFPVALVEFDGAVIKDIHLTLKQGQRVAPVSGKKVPFNLAVDDYKSYVMLRKVYSDGTEETEKVGFRTMKLVDFADDNPIEWKAVIKAGNSNTYEDVYTYEPGDVFCYDFNPCMLTLNLKRPQTYNGSVLQMDNYGVYLTFDMPYYEKASVTEYQYYKYANDSDFWCAKNDRDGNYSVPLHFKLKADGSSANSLTRRFYYVFNEFSGDPYFTVATPFVGMTVRKFEESLLSFIPTWNGKDKGTYNFQGPGNIQLNSISIIDEDAGDDKDLSITNPDYVFKANGHYSININLNKLKPQNFSYNNEVPLTMLDSKGGELMKLYAKTTNLQDFTVYSYEFSPISYTVLPDGDMIVLKKDLTSICVTGKTPYNLDMFDSIQTHKNLFQSAELTWNTTDPVFRPGNYRPIITLKTKPGVLFDPSNVPVFQFKIPYIVAFNVSMKSAVIKSDSSGQLYTEVVLKPYYRNVYVKDFTMTVKTPAAGEKPDYKPEVDIVVTPEVVWYDKTEGKELVKDKDVFIAGHEYELKAGINSTSYIFLGGKVNDTPYTKISEEKIEFAFEYKVPDNPPTNKPTAKPTVTSKPSVTAKPSAKPTKKPAKPTVTAKPTKKPAKPTVTAKPTKNPVKPTVTAKPTNKPAKPTVTAKPTTKPTTKPTVKPTVLPTKTPSVTIILNKTTDTLVCGATDVLKATVKGSSSKVIWKSSDTKVATVDSSGKVTAKMAGAALITATAAGKSVTCPVTVLYKDVTNTKDFWYAPTNYLTAAGVVKGYDKQTKFKPANECTRAQMVTFIWRLQGEPDPKAKTCKFSDVKEKDYFYKACIWGNENHIVEGYKDGTFGPQIVCARKHAVTFLWRLAGQPSPKSKENKFKDVKKGDYFYTATIWASENGILAGYKDGTFKPNGNCLRRQMVTFLYKYDKFVNKKG